MDKSLEAFAEALLIDDVVKVMCARFIEEGRDPAVVNSPESKAHGRTVAKAALMKLKKEGKI